MILIKQSDWLKIGSRHGILINSAWQGLSGVFSSVINYCQINDKQKWRKSGDYFHISDVLKICHSICAIWSFIALDKGRLQVFFFPWKHMLWRNKKNIDNNTFGWKKLYIYTIESLPCPPSLDIWSLYGLKYTIKASMRWCSYTGWSESLLLPYKECNILSGSTLFATCPAFWDSSAVKYVQLTTRIERGSEDLIRRSIWW